VVAQAIDPLPKGGDNVFGRKGLKERLIEEGYRESRNPEVLYRKEERDGQTVIHFVNLKTREEWYKEVGNGSGKDARPVDVEVTERVSDAARLYLQCFAAVEKDFPQLSREDTHKVASVLFKGLSYRGDDR
jgi:hypothetical protein